MFQLLHRTQALVAWLRPGIRKGHFFHRPIATMLMSFLLPAIHCYQAIAQTNSTYLASNSASFASASAISSLHPTEAHLSYRMTQTKPTASHPIEEHTTHAIPNSVNQKSLPQTQKVALTAHAVLESDSLALVDLYTSTGGSNWSANWNWLTGNVSDWNGITVEGGRVTYVELNNNNLRGSIPASFGNLTALKWVNLSNDMSYESEYNYLTGSIPATIGNLKALTYLNLSINSLAGPIPASIENLTALTYLNLETNQLTGPIPTNIGNLKALEYLNLERNKLSGSIPVSVDKLTALKQLLLYRNQLTGSIPNSIGQLGNLQSLDLSVNQLSGILPKSLGNLVGLTELSLSTNQLSGSIPESLGRLVNLEKLALASNQLTSNIPDSLGQLGKLQRLYLSSNHLSGAVPESLGKLATLREAVELANNELTSLPKFIGIIYTTSIQVKNNRLTFESLEVNAPNLRHPSAYTPQDSVGKAGKLSLSIGQSLAVAVGGAYNQYQWSKDGEDLYAATNPNLTFTKVQQGWYSCRITNTLIPDLTLYSRRVYVEVGPTITNCQASGTILQEIWLQAKGYDVRTIPITIPSTTTHQLTSFEGASKIANEYGDRIRGYICPPTSGNYTFWLASDDNGVLYLSSDDQPTKKQRIAWINGATKPREWTKYASQQSAPIYLEANKKYYIETLHKEAYGDDNIAVGWQLPTGTLQRPIPGTYLSPFPIAANARRANWQNLEAELASAANLSAAPNPFDDQTTIRFKAEATGKGTVAVYNVSGALVKVVFDGDLIAGETKELTLEGASLTSGVYLVKATSLAGVSHVKLVLTK